MVARGNRRWLGGALWLAAGCGDAGRAPPPARPAPLVAVTTSPATAASAPGRANERASSGVVHVSTPEVKPGQSVEGTFEFRMGEAGETLAGRFTASYCPQPELEPTGCR
jgi:hypothetical protein